MGGDGGQTPVGQFAPPPIAFPEQSINPVLVPSSQNHPGVLWQVTNVAVAPPMTHHPAGCEHHPGGRDGSGGGGDGVGGGGDGAAAGFAAWDSKRAQPMRKMTTRDGA